MKNKTMYLTGKQSQNINDFLIAVDDIQTHFQGGFCGERSVYSYLEEVLKNKRIPMKFHRRLYKLFSDVDCALEEFKQGADELGEWELNGK